MTVDALVTMVNIALGSSPISACPAGDANADGTISVDEIVAAVNNAVNGCPTPLLVTKTEDTADGSCDADCSLREAVQAANTHPGPDEILVPEGVFTLTLTGNNEDACRTGDLDILDDLTVSGVDAGLTVLDGNGKDRVIDILRGTVDISRVTVRNGSAGLGGGIKVRGLRPSKPVLRLSDSTLTGNEAAVGGGINAVDPGALSLSRCAITANAAGYGGGAHLAVTDTTLENCTISNNTADDFAGGLSIAGGRVRNCTITGNSVGTQNGASNMVLFADASAPSMPAIENTIVARGVGAPNCVHPFPEGYGNLTDDTSCTAPQNQSFTVVADAGLAPGVDPGTGVPVHPLCTGVSVPDVSCVGPSPALSAAVPSACPATDQRGVARLGPGCDIGAYEAE